MSERILSFRPFRRVGEKLVVTGYIGWRKLYTANYQGSTVRLLPIPEVKNGEVVYARHDTNGVHKYWHPTKFEPLFWPVNAIIRHIGYGGNEKFIYEPGVVHAGRRDGELNDNEVHSMFDCDGCPSFSHKTAIYVSENYPDKMNLFEPLTSDIVYKYFEIMREQLDKLNWIK